MMNLLSAMMHFEENMIRLGTRYSFKNNRPANAAIHALVQRLDAGTKRGTTTPNN